MASDYTDLATLKSWLKVTDSTDDALYSLAITAASRAIDKYTNRFFIADTSATARLFDAQNAYLLIVPDIASTSGLIVQTDNDSSGNFSLTWASGTDYQTEPGDFPNLPITAIRGLARYFPMNYQRRYGVKVTAKWGYPGTTAPEPVQQACLILATRIVKRKDSPAGVLGFGEMGGVVRVTNVDRDVQALLDSYKRSRRT